MPVYQTCSYANMILWFVYEYNFLHQLPVNVYKPVFAGDFCVFKWQYTSDNNGMLIESCTGGLKIHR